MKQSAKAISQDLEDVARRVATRQSEAAQRYGSLLSQFGKKKMTAGDFGAKAYQFAVEESARSFGDYVDIGMGYWRNFVGATMPAKQRGGKAAKGAASKRSRSGKKGGTRRTP